MDPHMAEITRLKRIIADIQDNPCYNSDDGMPNPLIIFIGLPILWIRKQFRIYHYERKLKEVQAYYDYKIKQHHK